MILEGVTITGNSAEYNGGGVWSFSATTITDSTIVDNSAVENGGGLYFDYADNFISGGAVMHNTAKKGGGMYIGSSMTVDVTASDWGFGQDQENVPNDVEHYSIAYGFFGNDVSFYCEGLDWNNGMCALK